MTFFLFSDIKLVWKIIIFCLFIAQLANASFLVREVKLGTKLQQSLESVSVTLHSFFGHCYDFSAFLTLAAC